MPESPSQQIKNNNEGIELAKMSQGPLLTLGVAIRYNYYKCNYYN